MSVFLHVPTKARGNLIANKTTDCEKRYEMYINKPDPLFIDSDRIREELELLLTQPSPLELAPCPGCQCHMPDQCSPKCAQAALALSSDPDKFPIEPKVIPLVYGLSVARLLQTCWSCEGHMNDRGELFRMPKISFYSASPIYAKMLLQHINALKTDRKLSYDWQIVLSDYAQTMATTYTLQPDLHEVQEPHLGRLQNDLLVIADKLPDQLKNQARNALKNL